MICHSSGCSQCLVVSYGHISILKFFILQVRLESIEAVNKILEEANKRIQPTGTGLMLLSFCSIAFKIIKATALSVSHGSEAVDVALCRFTVSILTYLSFCIRR